jgi:hypothetical protein
MIDRTLSIFLMLSFGITGMVILGMAWFKPMPVSETILTVLVGLCGVAFAVNRARFLKTFHSQADSEG